MSGARWLCLAALALACGTPPSSAFVHTEDEAMTATRRGAHAEAARLHERAASAAATERDAEEARYRAASSYERAGDFDNSQRLLQALSARAPSSERRARADFALADLWLASGRAARGQAQLLAAIRRNPDSGLARRGLERYLELLREHGGSAEVQTFLSAEGARLGQSELAETLAYRRARDLEDAGPAEAALAAYLDCAQRFPYPRGAYWDDALLRSAQLELKLGAPTRAVAHLQRLLAARESASIVGTYDRQYAAAQLELGRIYRDALHDPTRARQELRKVWQDHPKSRLADDALFEEALVARAAGDDAGTCAPLEILTSRLADSRYTACAHLLCERLAAKTQPCHDYIRRAAGLP